MSTDVATTESTTNDATLKTKRGGRKAKTAKAATKAAKKGDRGTAKRNSKSQREAGGTKKEIVLELLRRRDGATIADIAKATRWQNHSIRGFISGTERPWYLRWALLQRSCARFFPVTKSFRMPQIRTREQSRFMSQ